MKVPSPPQPFSVSTVRSLAASLALALWMFSASALAQTPTLTVNNAWVRMAPGSDVASVYLTLLNQGKKPITIVGVESPLASHAMVHETRIEGGIARMRPRDQITVAPGKTVKFEPEGLHIMLHGVTQTLAVGQSVPLVLQFSDGVSMHLNATVRPLTEE
jgi:copper(I)-binding protein